MLTARLSGPTEINLWHGVADQARARNLNLICFSGGIPRSRQQYEEQKNIPFNLAGEQNVDGLLVWANILSHTLDRSSLETFCRRYAPLPMISMGMVLPSIPSIRIDMREGMRKLLFHLIEEHGRRKIAFIRGPEVSQDAEERYQAYRETLAAYGLALDPGLVLPGDFGRNSGKAAIQQLADAHRMDFDALVTANDNMAIGALQSLQARGILVPDDVIVAGFDDIEAFQRYAVDMVELGRVDAVLITCSTMNRAYTQVQEALKPYGVPAYQIDRPMMEQAVLHGGRILVVATHGPTVESTQRLLQETAAELKREASFSGCEVEEAWTCLAKGDIAGHNAVLASAIREQVRCEGISCAVLAQLSMTIFLLSYPDPLAEFGIPVFTSGQCGFEFVRDQMRRK
jgi:DNA-binding LacI/PurR family transcriptional regulator